MANPTIVCDRCDYSFDAADPRAWINSKDIDGRALCPYCCIQVFHGSKAWSVWNDCQGIWDETVQPRRAASEEFLKTTHKDIGGRVVPVIVFPEHEDDVHMREWIETRDHGRSAA